MSVWPDIVVTKPDSPEVLFAVEVKAGAAASEAAEQQIKDYMVRQSCPIGMLVTAGCALFFRNPFTGYERETIHKIGECRTSELVDAKTWRTEQDLVRRVEEWLEALHAGDHRLWPTSAREAIESWVLPVVMSGVIRATGPRWRRTGS
jgi:hypothetical protein